MRYAIISQATHTVENVMEWDGESLWEPPKGTYLVQSDALQGSIYDPGTRLFSDPVVEDQRPLVPRSITRRQCAIELRERKLVSAKEALDMTRTGQPPAMISAVFGAMPEDQQYIAETDFAADEYLRANPLLVGIMQASGASDTEIDDFFRSAAAR